MIDAVLGVEANLAEVAEPYISVLATLKQIRVPLVSLDVPSGMSILTHLLLLSLVPLGGFRSCPIAISPTTFLD